MMTQLHDTLNNDTEGTAVSDESVNPYATPTACVVEQVEGDYVPADRGTRLKAFVLDVLIYMSGFLVMVTVTLSALEPEKIVAALLGHVLFLVVIFLVNLVFLYKDGQTIGKKMAKIRIADKVSGRQASFRRAFLGRSGIPLLLFIFMSVLPVPGKETYFWIIWILFWSINSLTIFGTDRRALRDYMAGTIVIKA